MDDERGIQNNKFDKKKKKQEKNKLTWHEHLIHHALKNIKKNLSSI